MKFRCKGFGAVILCLVDLKAVVDNALGDINMFCWIIYERARRFNVQGELAKCGIVELERRRPKMIRATAEDGGLGVVL